MTHHYIFVCVLDSNKSELIFNNSVSPSKILAQIEESCSPAPLQPVVR